MSEVSRTERELAWLACQQQRAAARRDRLRQAAECCADCAAAGRTVRLDRARYHTEQAEHLAAGAVQAAGDAAKAALRARRGNIIATAIMVPLSLIVLFFSVMALING